MQWIVALGLGTAFVVLSVGALVAWLRHVSATGRWSWPKKAIVDGAPDAARVCPSCARRFAADARFCAGCATPLAWVEGEVVDARLGCPRCDRLYASGMRFCPVDAEELVRVDPADEQRRHRHSADLAGADMICPVCAARWAGRAHFCGRDGARLCPLH